MFSWFPVAEFLVQRAVFEMADGKKYKTVWNIFSHCSDLNVCVPLKMRMVRNPQSHSIRERPGGVTAQSPQEGDLHPMEEATEPVPPSQHGLSPDPTLLLPRSLSLSVPGFKISQQVLGAWLKWDGA